MTLKCVYRVTMNPYLYSTRNFPLYPMWDVTKFYKAIQIFSDFIDKQEITRQVWKHILQGQRVMEAMP